MFKAIGLGAAGLLGALSAEAAVITQDRSYSFGDDHLILSAGPNGSSSAAGQQITRSVSFDQFDATLGALQSVGFSFTAGGTRVVGFTHNGGGSGTLQALIFQSFGFDLGGGLLAPNSLLPFNLSAAPSDIPAGSYLGASQNLNILPAFNTSYDLTAELASFLGAGVVALDVFFLHPLFDISATGDGLTITAISGSCDPSCFNFGTSGPAAGTATLTYTYVANDVPEPASLALLAVGLLGLGAARRRPA